MVYILLRLLPLLSQLPLIHGHGTLNSPIPRASGGQIDEATPWCAGDSCYWFSQGCFPGCAQCSGNIFQAYPEPHDWEQTGCGAVLPPTNNDAELRTWATNRAAGDGDDWTSVTPWRRPGSAPLLDPCGVASGMLPPHESPPDGIPAGFEQGHPGSELPRIDGVCAEWEAGSEVSVSWSIYVNHGGGYTYRILPAHDLGRVLRSLHFATNATTVHYHDGSRPDFMIPAVDVSAGTEPAGSVWRKNPVPACNCDFGASCSRPPPVPSGKEPMPFYEAYVGDVYGPERCPTGTMFEPLWDEGYGSGVKNNDPFAFSLVDSIVVPEDIPLGRYVLQFRWDCEQTPQSWTSCADVDIVASSGSRSPTN